MLINPIKAPDAGLITAAFGSEVLDEKLPVSTG